MRARLVDDFVSVAGGNNLNGGRKLLSESNVEGDIGSRGTVGGWTIRKVEEAGSMSVVPMENRSFVFRLESWRRRRIEGGKGGWGGG